MKRLGVAALLVVLAAMFAASPALARKPVATIRPVSYTYELTPPEIDPAEPQASGQWTVETWSLPSLSVEVKVSCRRLTPGEHYHVMCIAVWCPMSAEGEPTYYPWLETHDVTADGKGRLSAQFTVEASEPLVFVDTLWVENATGNVVLEEP